MTNFYVQNAALKTLALSTVIFTLSISSFATSVDTSKIAVHGHRGARGMRPENTIPAFQYAISLGVDFLEMDMAVTKDGKIVISHDPFISKVICLDPQKKPIVTEPLIHSMTLAEVQSYDCGSLQNPRFPEQVSVPGTRRPTLDEVFELTEKSNDPHAKTVKFNIETKIFADHPEYTVSPTEFVQLFYAVVKKHHLEKRVVLQSFDFRTLAEMRKIDASIPLSALVETSPDPRIPTANLVEVAKRTGAEIISPESILLTPAIVESLHRMHVQVHPWTVNTAGEWQKLVAMKVDGIISDYPNRLIEYLKEAHRPR
jgi:glycerophosphoryl diester phosphodiesterase